MGKYSLKLYQKQQECRPRLREVKGTIAMNKRFKKHKGLGKQGY